MLSFSGDPVFADYNNPDTDWMRDGKYGLHVKYLNWVRRNETTIEEFNQWVNAFDVNAFAEDVELTGASWVIWGLGRTWFNSPNATLESTVGDFTSDRDLPLEIYDALHERGIRLMLYAAGDKAITGEDRAGKVALGWDGTNDNYTRTFVNNWADALQVWSDRYGTKVSGWWFDHSYPNYAVSDTACGTSNPELAIYRTHLLSGNPDDGIVGINHGNRMGGELCHSPEDDYRAGHIRKDSLEVASSRWWNGLQWHYMFPIGTSGWGSPYVRWDTQEQIDYVNENNRNEGVNTFSVFVYTMPGESAEGVVKVPGSLSNAQLRQLAALRDASPRFVDNTSSDISFNGTWAKQDDGMDFRGSTSWSAVVDNHAEMAFTGTGVEVVVRKGPNGGLVDVVLDGNVVVDDFDTYSSTTEYKQTIYDNQTLSSGSHTIRLVATGRKNASATEADAMLDYFAVTKLDTTAPRVLSITSDATHPTKDPFTVTIDFLEDVTGLTAGEIAVNNGTGANLTGTGASYTLDIEPIANLEGKVTVRVPADAAEDGANNGNLERSETFAVDAQAPAFQNAAVDGARLTLAYNEELDRFSVPPTNAFTVTGSAQAQTVSQVVVGGTVVELTLNPGVEQGEAGIRVSYTPGMNPIRDVPGNQAEGLSQVSVTNDNLSPLPLLPLYTVSSPDGSLTATVAATSGNLSYTVSRDGTTLIADSPLSIRDVTAHTVTGNATTSHDSTWEPTWGQFSRIRDHHNRLTLNLDVGGLLFDLIFQVYDDGLGFRFVADEQASLTGKILSYKVRYNMDGSYWAYWPMGESSPEGPHPMDALPSNPRRSVVVVYAAGNDQYFALLESDLFSADAFEAIKFWRVNGEAALKTNHKSQTVPAGDFVSPWRVVLVGDTPGDLLESTVALNLAAPLVLDDASWVKPGKALSNWRTLGYQTDDGLFTYRLNTATLKRLIDFAADNGIEYVDVDDDWFTRINNGQLVSQASDFDIEEVIAHADTKGVAITIYVDQRPAARITNTTDEQLYQLFSNLGGSAIKYGFRGNDAPFTRAALQGTAAKQMLINFHDDPTPMTGARRTMPNAITRQTGWGQQDNRRAFAPTDFLEMAMINALMGPFDQVNGIYDLNEMPDRDNGSDNLINSTVAGENARVLIMFSGMTNLPDVPEEYAKKADMFEFLREMPVTWDETRILHSSLPHYITTARRSGKAWFVCSATNESAKTLNSTLDFLEAGVTYNVTYYEDDHDGTPPTHYIDNRETYQVRTGMVTSADTVSAVMVAGGGHCMWIRTQPLLPPDTTQPVLPPDTTAPVIDTIEITSNPGPDATYAAGETIEVTVTFDETVAVTGMPRLTLNVGGVDRAATYGSGTGAALVFAYPVADSDLDTDGVSIEANRLSLNGGTIKDGSNNNAVLDHDLFAADSGHKVDGVKPVLAATDGAAVNEAALTLTYGEALDAGSVAEPGDFTLAGGDHAWTVTGVRVNGSTVELTLDVGAEHGEAGILVSYTPGTNPIQDVPGNDAEALSREPVSNETPDTTPPEVESLAVSSNPGPDRTYAAEDDIQVTVIFSKTVEVTGTPRLQIELGGGRRTADYQGGSGTAALVFAYEVADGESDTDGVGIEANSLSGGTIRDEVRNNAVLGHDGLAADSGHKVDAVKPELAATGGAVVNGTTLTLTYNEVLDASSTPEADDFTPSGGDRVRTVSRVVVRGMAVELALDPGAEHGEAGIVVSYTPGMKPIRDVPGNQAEGLSRESVTNETPDTAPPEVESLAVNSNPGADQTYAAGDEIEVTVTFSETVEVEGTPRLRLRVGNRTRTAGYLRGTDTAALVFGYEVAEGDEDTGGVSIEAGRISLNGGTIEDEAENAAELDHEAVAAQAGHQVDGVRPSFLSAAVDGSSLTLTYGEALDGGSRPASGDFTVEVGGSGRNVTGVSVSGSVVTLTLNPAVEHGDTGIRVSYSPGTDPIQDAVGNEAWGLSSQSVTNTTGAQNTAPEITSPSSFDVRENQLVVRRLAARDTDAGDEVTGWEIVGGVDQSEFSIASDTGEMSFRDPPDFEAPGDNEYEVRVEVRSGAGARELEAEKTFTVSVTDEREPPDVPEVPAFSGETADSLTVSWTEPDNTGPAITDYDVQYREKGTGRFTDAQHDGPGRTLTLSDLKAGTDYEVQMRATNEEGTSDWSASGEGRTVTPLTVVMASGTEPPVSGPFRVRFSFSEPVTGFGGSDVETGQDPACTDDQNNTVFCDPGIGGLQTADNRVFTTTVTPQTDRVAHSYTLRLTVAGGAVRSSVGSKPKEEPEEPLEVRVAPPGVTEPISSIGLRASSGSGSMRLSWNRPSEDGGSAIIRYEVRYQAVGEAWSEWENVGAGSRGVTVGNLINGNEYIFEVRAVNGLGKGGAEMVRATPERRIAPPPPPPPPPPPGGGGGGGGGGGLLFPPEAPAGLMAMAGDGAVRLEWSPPESDGGAPILRYEYRLKEGRGAFGEWTPIDDSAPGEVNASGYTVERLGNGTVYIFELRAVNLVGGGRVSEAVEAVMGLDRAYWSNFLAGDLQGIEAGLERGSFGGTPQSLRLRFGAELRFEESELDGEGEVRGTRSGSYGYRYTSRTTGELSLDYDGGEACELRLNFRGVGAGSYSFRCGGVLGGQGSFELTGLNRGPEITSLGPFEVAENQRMVGQLEAVDQDKQDEITEYGIAGGADGALFALEAGELMFREAPDYEDPSDVESAKPESGAADNEYIVVVEVRSGEGERERKGSRAIRVRVSDEEELPEITSVGPFEVVENQTMVEQLEAVDQDKQDQITGYGIAGGADGGLFAVVEETGELMFREAPDYENPGDVASDDPQSGAADNEYIVVVEVRSGEGERERKGSRAIRVRVSDEEEPPAAPVAPVVTAEGSDSLKVSWREPENRGPEIVDYEVRYREGSEAGYSDGEHEGTGLEVRLLGLKEETVYEVQVRAVNEEGMSEWSEPGEGRTDPEEADPDDPSDFTGEDLEGRRLRLRNTGEEGTAGSLELRFGEGNRFDQIESGGQEAATRAEGASRSGSYTYEKTGPRMGTVRLDYDDGASCEIQLSFTESGVGAFAFDCGDGDAAEGSFRLTTGSLFVPVILSSAGQNNSFFTSELTLTNRGDQDVKLDYSYSANRGEGSGAASDVLPAGRQRVETDALTYLRDLGVPIPETGNRIGTLRVEARLGSEVEAVVRTTTVVPEGRAGLAYLGVAEEEGFDEAVYLCGLRQNGQDRSNVAFQNMGAPEEGAITLRTTVYSGAVSDTSPRVLEDVKLESGGFHQYSGLLGRLESVEGNRQGYVKVERVEGTASFYAYGVINDQANSDGSFVFPVAASWLEGTARQTLPVVVETSAFTSELTVTNFSDAARTLDFQFVSEGIETTGNAAGFSMRLEAGQQEIIPEVVDELRRQGVAGLGSTRGFYAGPLFAVAESGDMSGIVIGARTGSEGGGGSYSVFYNAVPEGGAFTKEAWVDGLQQNEENRSNLALVNTGEVDGSPSVFHLEIYDGETGLLEETVVTKPIPARRWHQINGILGSYAPETRQGYIRIEKVSGENPFLAYGVVNDGGAPGERSGDGAYLPARE